MVKNSYGSKNLEAIGWLRVIEIPNISTLEQLPDEEKIRLKHLGCLMETGAIRKKGYNLKLSTISRISILLMHQV